MGDASKNQVPNFTGWMAGPSARDHVLVNLGYPFSTRGGAVFYLQTPLPSPGVGDTQPGSGEVHPHHAPASEARVTF